MKIGNSIRRVIIMILMMLVLVVNSATLTDDQIAFQNKSTLVLGMGVGTFLFLFFVLVITAIFVFSTPCTTSEKILWRGISFILFVITLLIIFFAERGSKYTKNNVEKHQYDFSIIPRIAICCMMIVFTIVAIVNVIDHTGESKEMLTSDNEHTALWQH